MNETLRQISPIYTGPLEPKEEWQQFYFANGGPWMNNRRTGRLFTLEEWRKLYPS